MKRSTQQSELDRLIQNNQTMFAQLLQLIEYRYKKEKASNS